MNSVIDNVSIHSVENLNGKIPGYKVTDFIAKGGMGAVYLGLQENLDREVAIKILPPELTVDENFSKAFQTEAKAMAKVSHSNLVGIYDFGKIDNFLYIVMEFIKGRTLFNVINGSAVEETEAAELIIAMSRGLNRAHDAGIIHRDIKPANVLIDDQGVPKIVDFGLARPTEETENGVIFGTPGYTAPEVIKNPKAVDRKSDIFSIGVMLFELLTGELPSKFGQLPSSISNSHKQFDSIVAKATHPVSAMRYKTAADMADDLQKAIDTIAGKATTVLSGRAKLATGNTPSKARPAQASLTGRPSGFSTAPKFVPKKSGFPVGLVAVFAILLAGIGLAVVALSGSGKQDQVDKPEVANDSKTSSGAAKIYSGSSKADTKKKPDFKKIDLNADASLPEIARKKIESSRTSGSNSSTTITILEGPSSSANTVKTKFGARKISSGNDDSLLFTQDDLESVTEKEIQFEASDKPNKKRGKKNK